jgi:hypothetical protein
VIGNEEFSSDSGKVRLEQIAKQSVKRYLWETGSATSDRAGAVEQKN